MTLEFNNPHESKPLSTEEEIEVVEIINNLLTKANSQAVSTLILLQRFIDGYVKFKNQATNKNHVINIEKLCGSIHITTEHLKDFDIETEVNEGLKNILKNAVTILS